MENRSLNFKVGLFVLAGAALLVLLAVFAVGSSIGRDGRSYAIHFQETVKGMVRGSPVNFQGVNIGIVSDMRFVDGETVVTIHVDPGKAPIQTATRASLDRAWVTGQVTVELSGWSPGGELLPEHGRIPAELSAGAVVMKSMPEAVQYIAQLVEELHGLGKNLNRLVADDSRLLGQAERTLADLGDASQRISALLSPDNLERVAGILRHAEGAAAAMEQSTLPALTRVAEEMGGLPPRVASTLDRVEAVAASVARLSDGPTVADLLAEAGQLAAALRQEMPRLAGAAQELAVFLRGNRRELRETLSGAESALREIQALVRLLRGAPSALVFGRTVPAATPQDVSRPARPPAMPGRGGRE